MDWGSHHAIWNHVSLPCQEQGYWESIGGRNPKRSRYLKPPQPKPTSSMRELRDASRLYPFQPCHELLPDTFLQALTLCVAEPIRHPVLLDLTTRKELSVTLFASHQTMQDCTTAHLGSPCHQRSNRLVHDLGESSCVPAQASRAETRGDHVYYHARTLYRTQRCKLANSTLFYELGKSISGLILC